MNRTALKNYAPKARLDFIRAVTDRAAFYGVFPGRIEPATESGDVVIIGGRAFPSAVSFQRRALASRVQEKGFDQVMEAMAYTWFNRFVALRYMELHGYLDHGYRVLSPPPDSTTETLRAQREEEKSLRALRASVVETPEILHHAEHVTLPGLDAQKVIELKLAGNQDAVLYRLLLVAQCNALHEAMPFLFERIADDTELLLPDNLLHSDSVIRKLVNEIEEADWQQVEIIGWLYQFYISDKKDEVIGKVVKSEDIPAATQLFTPNWIVKYLVQNTLGRQWLATYPNSPLRQQMEYYIEPAEQTEEVKAQLAAITPKSLDPETLTLLDPASGSGHILVEAYDLFKAIYQERGYRSKDIPRLILEKNLFGLEIDDRAAQLAAFALLMKARADDRRIFADRIQPSVLAIQESKGLEALLGTDITAGEGKSGLGLPLISADMQRSLDEITAGWLEQQLNPSITNQPSPAKPTSLSLLAPAEPCLRQLIKLFENGKTFGSLIRVPPQLAAQLPTARQNIEAMAAKGQLWEHRAATLLLPLVKQAELLARTYDAVATNPPYMGSRGMNAELRSFGEREYPDSKSDLFAIFTERLFTIIRPNGYLGVMTPFTWMFIKSYEHLRHCALDENTLLSLIQPEYHAFFDSAYVPICTFVVQRSSISRKSVFIKLTDFYGEEVQPIKALEAIHSPTCSWRHTVFTGAFRKIPTSPLAYWITDRERDMFVNGELLSQHAFPKKGLDTGDNNQFLRLWHEVSLKKVSFASRQGDAKWFPYNKGGDYRKWYGNREYLINWENDGADIRARLNRASKKPTLRNQQYYFRAGFAWTTVSSSNFSARYTPEGALFDNGGCTLFSDSNLLFWGGLLNSKVAARYLEFLSPTLNFQPGDIGRIVYVRNINEASIAENVKRLIELAKADWDAFETSWDFEKCPLLRGEIVSERLDTTFARWRTNCLSVIEEAKVLEEANNRLLIAAYNVGEQMSYEVSDDRITLARADQQRDMQRLVSYAIGCLMGRYSLDKPGLIYAHNRNEGFDSSQYRTFPADADGIIPITELAWFPDDATERFVEFITKAWPREHLEENLKFIADSLGPNRDEHPRDTIRRYLATGLYKDHLQTYKKRPIYWLFSSGKQRAFQCLVYLHRYHEGTLARMRTEYVIPLQGKIAHRIEQLAGDITAATSTSHRRKLEKEKEALGKQSTELATFDEKLRHYADQRIALDLDDGVKVNYGKFGDLLAEVKAVTGGTEE